MGHLEALETVSVLCFLADDIHGFVDDLGSLCVVTLRPAVASSVLAENHVVRAEELANWGGSDRVYDARLQVNQDGSWHVAASICLVIVNIDPLQLQVRLSAVLTIWVDAVLVRDDLPELRTYLVSALSGLNVHDFSHFSLFVCLSVSVID